MPNVSYNIFVEVLRSPKRSLKEEITKIIIDDVDIGPCNPTDNTTECGFLSCPNTEDTPYTVMSETGVVDVVIEYEGHSWGCNCDISTWQCSFEFSHSQQVPMVAVARITIERASSNSGN